MQNLPFRATIHAKKYAGIDKIPVSIVLDRVRSLYNVGAFFRSADAAAIEKLYLTGYTGHPPHPGIAKTALGAEDQVSWEHHWDPLPIIDSLYDSGHQVAVIETDTHSIDLYEWQPAFPVCLVLGNEVDGVLPEVSERADVRIRIPMLGVKQSLNVAVAGGVVMYELLRKYVALQPPR